MGKIPKINLKKQLGDEQIALLVVPNEQYSKIIIDVAKQLARNYKHICYVSLNKLYDPLVKSLAAKKVNLDKFFFIDCISRGVTTPTKVKNCEFLSGPQALTEMHISISKNLKAKKSEALLFDSLSTLLVYEREVLVIRFVHGLIGAVRGVGSKAFLTVLEADTKGELVKNLSMFTDRTIRF
ncbi:MAG: hypothetical protein ACE5OT_01360 [Candidatus Hadarchaeaceae archaeon]